MSHDGQWLAVANYLPHTLTILATADLSVAKVIDVSARDGTTSRVSAVYQLHGARALSWPSNDAAEIWEIATDPLAGPFS